MLVDDVTVRFVAGGGGRGSAAFNKVRLALGPTGGDGGRGGNISLEGVSDINALAQYASKKEMHAENGKDGRGQFIDGRDGDDLVLKVPTGTRITNLGSGFLLPEAAAGEEGISNFDLRPTRLHENSKKVSPATARRISLNFASLPTWDSSAARMPASRASSTSLRVQRVKWEATRLRRSSRTSVRILD